MLLPQDAIFIKGDTIELEFQLFRNKSTNEYWNLTGNDIRFQLNSTPAIKKGSENVPGGSNEQISILDATKGQFRVTIAKDESSELSVQDYNYEVEITTDTGARYTVLQSSLRIVEESINWEEIESGE